MQLMLLTPLSLRKHSQCYVQVFEFFVHAFLCASHLGRLVLVVVVDLLVPEKSLVSIPPEEVLCPDVLVWVFDSFLQGWEMAPVFPMLIPEVLGVDTSKDETGDNHAVVLLVSWEVFSPAGVVLYR